MRNKKPYYICRNTLNKHQTCILLAIKLGFAAIQLYFCALQVRNNFNLSSIAWSFKMLGFYRSSDGSLIPWETDPFWANISGGFLFSRDTERWNTGLDGLREWLVIGYRLGYLHPYSCGNFYSWRVVSFLFFKVFTLKIFLRLPRST